MSIPIQDTKEVLKAFSDTLLKWKNFIFQELARSTLARFLERHRYLKMMLRNVRATDSVFAILTSCDLGQRPNHLICTRGSHSRHQ